MCNVVCCGGTWVRPVIVLLKQDIINICPLSCDVILRFFRMSVLSFVAPFSKKSVSTTPLEFRNAVNITFSAEALVVNLSGHYDLLW